MSVCWGGIHICICRRLVPLMPTEVWFGQKRQDTNRTNWCSLLCAYGAHTCTYATHPHMHPHGYTCGYTCLHTHVHVHATLMQRHATTWAHVCKCICMHTYMHTHMHTCQHVYENARAQANTMLPNSINPPCIPWSNLFVPIFGTLVFSSPLEKQMKRTNC